MTDPRRTPANRRSSDSTISALKDEVDQIKQRVERIDDKVDDVYKLLITEPEASPLGRALLSRAIENRSRIDANNYWQDEHDKLHTIEERKQREAWQLWLNTEFRPIADWRTEWRGVWRFMVGLSTVLAVLAAFLALGDRFGAW